MNRELKLGVAILVVVALAALLFQVCMQEQQPPQVVQIATSSGRLETYKLTLSAVGAAGEATGYVTTSALIGTLDSVYMDYGSSISGTTGLTVTFVDAYAGNLFSIMGTATDQWVYPSHAITQTGAAVTNAWAPYALDGRLQVMAAQTTSGTVGYMYIRYWRP
jgi:hypothetical protein